MKQPFLLLVCLALFGSGARAAMLELNSPRDWQVAQRQAGGFALVHVAIRLERPEHIPPK